MGETISADLCVIGAGAGGLSVAAGAAQLGRKVVLIEKGAMGGDCLNAGCVPSKALLAAASRAAAVRNVGEFGIRASAPEIDFPAVMDHVHCVIAAIAPHDSQERFEGLGVRVIRAHATFTGPRSVEAGGAVVKAKHFVIATGSSPAVPPIDGIAQTPFFTNETIFENRKRPERLVILGGGPVGVEMAQAHQRLGSQAVLIEQDTILNRDDPELVGVLRDALVSEGVDIRENARAIRARPSPRGVEVDYDDRNDGAGLKTVQGSHLLVAVGRRANVDGLNLAAAGVETNERGVAVDDRLRTANKRIYAIGDVIGGPQFTHTAGYHASIVIRNILFKAPAKNRDALSPRVTFCDPELAQAGLTEQAAREKGYKISVARWPFADNDRAQAERETAGFVKVVTKENGRILGAAVVGGNAGDLIQPWALAIAGNLGVKAFKDYIAPYPTRGEASKRAAGAWYAPMLFSGRTKALVSLLSILD
ncbi:MAG: dihydrolipoyl dehydrogenase family protein [Parvularculaceae bacterium]